jgi:predicted DsbA family dithiol-disulfide isomerase
MTVSALDVADLARHATELGLDVERFDEDLAYGAFADVIRGHQRSAVSSVVTTTPPTGFVDGRLLSLGNPPEELPGALAH